MVCNSEKPAGAFTKRYGLNYISDKKLESYLYIHPISTRGKGKGGSQMLAVQSPMVLIPQATLASCRGEMVSYQWGNKWFCFLFLFWGYDLNYICTHILVHLIIVGLTYIGGGGNINRRIIRETNYNPLNLLHINP